MITKHMQKILRLCCMYMYTGVVTYTDVVYMYTSVIWMITHDFLYMLCMCIQVAGGGVEEGKGGYFQKTNKLIYVILYMYNMRMTYVQFCVV